MKMNFWDSLKWRMKFRRDFKNMSSFTTMDELYEYAVKQENQKFIIAIIEDQDASKFIRRTGPEEHIQMLSYFDIDLTDKAVLELGPGWGEFLRLAESRDAKTLDFVDYHPYYFTYNRLLGFNGFKNDYYGSQALRGIPIRNYDVILSRGSINADRFEREFFHSYRNLGFQRWLNRLEFLAKPGADIIICPTYDVGWGEFEFTNIGRRKVFEWMVFHGYKMITDIDKFNHPKCFPFVFHKKVSLNDTENGLYYSDI